MDQATYEFWRLPRVEEVVGFKRSSILEKVAEGTFPAPVKIGPRAIAWRSDLVRAWMDQRAGIASAAAPR